ncbi:MAG: endoribonuclease MazF [Xenococcaceae cyanobacterium]
MSYCPEQGDIIWLDFNPQLGREQANRRPSLVLSPFDYNRTVKLVLVCPITSRSKGYPFEVLIPDGLAVSGVILSDQIKSFDWQLRKSEFICKAPDNIIRQVVVKINIILP